MLTILFQAFLFLRNSDPMQSQGRSFLRLSLWCMMPSLVELSAMYSEYSYRATLCVPRQQNRVDQFDTGACAR